MDTGTLALLIPIFALGLGGMGIYFRHQRRMAEINAAGESGHMRHVIDKLERMEQRLAVLERLAIDPAKRLADDIDRLR